MSNELTEAERVVAEHVARLINDEDQNPSLRMLGKRGYELDDEITRVKPEWFVDEARAVVTAVRPIIEAEALNRHADKIDALPPGGESLNGVVWYRDGLRDAAMIARDEANAIPNNP